MRDSLSPKSLTPRMHTRTAGRFGGITLAVAILILAAVAVAAAGTDPAGESVLRAKSLRFSDLLPERLDGGSAVSLWSNEWSSHESRRQLLPMYLKRGFFSA